jgi:hypothetical protein
MRTQYPPSVGIQSLVIEMGSVPQALRAAREKPLQLAKMGLRARREFEQHYAEDANYDTLMNINDAAISEGRRP